MLQKNLLNKHFHDERKGCEIETKISWVKIIKKFCKTHRKRLCHCGWEWSWHYGTYSKGLDKGSSKASSLRKVRANK